MGSRQHVRHTADCGQAYHAHCAVCGSSSDTLWVEGNVLRLQEYLNTDFFCAPLVSDFFFVTIWILMFINKWLNRLKVFRAYAAGVGFVCT